MIDNILVMNDKKLAFEIDENKSLIYIYYVYYSKIENKSKAILKTLNSELAQEISEYFKIDIQKYNVEIDNSKPRNITKQEKEKIYKNKFIKYLMILLALFTFFVMTFPDQSVVGYINKATSSLAYIALFAIAFLLIMIVGEEQFEETRVTQHIKYNIVTISLPTQKEVIASLEAKIDQLVEKNNDK